jgi:hypothetical protein
LKAPELVINRDGDKCWYINNHELHRIEIDPNTGLSLPAYEGRWKSWWVYGVRHRDDGPAIEYANGQTQYHINGKHIPQLDNKHIYGKEKLAKLLMLL